MTHPIVSIFRRHFPGVEISEHEFLFSELDMDPARLGTGSRAAETEKIDRVERHLRAALAALRELHPDVKAALDAGMQTNDANRPPGLSVAKGRTASPALVLELLLWSLTGRHEHPVPAAVRPQRHSEPARDRARRAIASMHEPRPHALRAMQREKTLAKVALVDHVVSAWRRWRGEEPSLHSVEFLALVQDLIAAREPPEDAWDAKAVVRTYSRQIKGLPHTP
ncbi:MAG: hypothetical protein ACOCYW_05365 [Roseicyclus sp.]